jgi:hypothetical protein
VRFAPAPDSPRPVLFGDIVSRSFTAGELAITSDSGHLSEFLALEELACVDSSGPMRRLRPTSSSDYYQTESESDMRAQRAEIYSSERDSDSDSVSEFFKRNP